jgi:Rieske Fe-S protein
MQCAVYVREYFGKPGTNLNAKDFWTATTTERTANNGQTISPPCIAVWDGDSSNGNLGHVGVVESVSPANPGGGTTAYRYSDANRKNDGKVVVNTSITESGIKAVVPAKFLGYVKYK